MFLLFAAALVIGLAFGATSAEASLPRVADAVAPDAAATHSPASRAVTRELVVDDALEHGPDPALRLGFAEELCLLEPDQAQAGFVLFERETRRCERTYARNNPLRFVDPDGMAPREGLGCLYCDLPSQMGTVYAVATGRDPGEIRNVMALAGLSLGVAVLAAAGPEGLPASAFVAGTEAVHSEAAVGLAGLGVAAAGGAAPTSTSRMAFALHQRVPAQLLDFRLGSLTGKLNSRILNDLVNNNTALRVMDLRSKNLNILVIQKVGDVLLRIAVARDKMTIVSVGVIRQRQVENLLSDGKFVKLP